MSSYKDSGYCRAKEEVAGGVTEKTWTCFGPRITWKTGLGATGTEIVSEPTAPTPGSELWLFAQSLLFSILTPSHSYSRKLVCPTCSQCLSFPTLLRSFERESRWSPLWTSPGSGCLQSALSAECGWLGARWWRLRSCVRLTSSVVCITTSWEGWVWMGF